MKLKNYLFPFFAAIHFMSFGQGPKIHFESNKNQWPDQVLYKADIKGGSLFLEKNTFTYVFMENNSFDDEGRDTRDSAKIKFHSFKVNFQNSNADVNVSGNNLLTWHKNYYIGNDPKKWADHVKLYEEVYYKELYSHIDMKVYNAGENLKYDLIVNPGGNPKDIQMNYNGPDEMHLEYGHLYIKTSVGLIIEQKPFAYQLIDGVKKEVACSYKLKNNSISFSIDGKYDNTLPLVIDPTLIASTYTGSLTDNRGYTATYDSAGNIYIGGKAYDAGYPVMAGAYQSSFPGSAAWAITLSKLNANGRNLLYSTYFGGGNSGDDQQPHSMIVNSNNELFVVGRTNSTSFPTTGGVFHTTNAGGFDIFLGKFNSAGGLLASTYLGGSGDDCVNVSIGSTSYALTKYSWGDDARDEIILDASSNVYVVGCTQSSNFPTTAGAFQNSLKGTQDAVVFKMDSSLTTLGFSTYLGGSGCDAGYGLRLDNSSNIYITGGTTSCDFPIPVAGVIYPACQGGVADGFIAEFNPSASGAAQLVRSTYLGTASYDQAFFIDIDAAGDLYIYGQTKGSYPVTPGVYSNSNGGMFIHKINGQLNSTIFSTVIGSGANKINLSPTAFLVDSCQAIYLAGWGRCNSTWAFSDTASIKGMPITPNAWLSTTDGCDFYFMVLAPNAKSLLYASPFGQNGGNPDHVDGGTSRIDKHGIIYEAACAGCTGTQGFPTTPGAFSNTNNSTDNSKCNNAVVKMDLRSLHPLAVANINGPSNGCAPFAVQFNNTGSMATDFIWDFGDGSPLNYTSSPNYTYSTTGTYTVTLYAVDSMGICSFLDTANIIINVGFLSIAATTQNSVCPGLPGSATATPSGGANPYTYSWNTSPVQTSSTATALMPGGYTVTVSDAAGCTGTKAINIFQTPALSATTAITNASSCAVNDGHISAIVSGGTLPYTFSWNIGATTASISGLGQGVYILTVTDSNGCTKIKNDTVTCVTAIRRLTQQTDIIIYPNPTNGLFNISCPQNISEISVYDLLGRKIYQSTNAVSGKSTSVDLSSAPAGIYFLNTRTADGVAVKKIIKE